MIFYLGKAFKAGPVSICLLQCCLIIERFNPWVADDEFRERKEILKKMENGKKLRSA